VEASSTRRWWWSGSGEEAQRRERGTGLGVGGVAVEMGNGSVLPENARVRSGPRIMQRQMQNPLERLQWLFSPHFEGATLDRDAAGDSLIAPQFLKPPALLASGAEGSTGRHPSSIAPGHMKP
jgi:hypothetical protein